MTTATFPSHSQSQSASQTFTYEAKSGITYTLRKLPAMRYLALGNALVTYFGDGTLRAVIALVKKAKTTNIDDVANKTEAELIESIVAALEDFGGLSAIPMNAFQSIARLMCPFVDVKGKAPVLPHETNEQLVDTQIDMLFADAPSDILAVLGRAIAFNMSDFFSGGSLPSILKRRTASA